jgi:ferric-dicitrate binding protein FerR (iron transport regulator)
VAGEAYLKVFKDAAAPFLINTDYLQIEVLGTEFNLSFYEDMAETTLIEGSIKLTTKGAHPQTIVLSPNQKAIYNTKSEYLHVIPTSTYTETAWLRGELIFRSSDFAHIMDKLKIRYGIDIEIENNKYDSDLFTGNFQTDSIDKILKILQLHYKFTYKYTANDKILIKFR